MSKEFSADFEMFVVSYYTNKVQSCKDRGIEFKLNLVSVRNLLSAKKCGYTGLDLTRGKKGLGMLSTDVTIDRIDNSLGYVKGNVIAVSNVANNFKSIFENPVYKLDMLMAEKALNKIQKKIKQVKERQ
jgi:hypothetical protein